MKNGQHASRTGYTLIEALIALVLLSIVMVPIGQVLGSLGRWNFQGRNRDEALQLAREATGQILSIPADSLRDSAWSRSIGWRTYGIRREVEDSADILRRFPDAKVDARGRPTALRGPQEYAIFVAFEGDTLVHLPGLRARETAPR
jgi:prepilin-type N-terminal cleavage/methylation domain-containing protein